MSQISKDQIEAALEHGIDVAGRRIFLHGDVDNDSIGTAIRGMYLMPGDASVELFVSSFGGDLEEVFALHDVTRTIRCPIHTVALGKCQSAAPLLVACGRKGQRWAAENARFMLHNSHIEDLEGTPKQVEVYRREIELLGDRFNTLLARYTNKDKRFWARLQSKDTDQYFDAAQALEWGLVDNLWSEKD